MVTDPPTVPFTPVGPTPLTVSLTWVGVTEEADYVGRGVGVDEECVYPPGTRLHGDGDPLFPKMCQGCPSRGNVS